LLREVRRVLGGGEFHFDSEPYKKALKTNFIKLKKEPFRKVRGLPQKILTYFKYWFVQWPIIESEYNVIENYDLTIDDYLRGASLFDDYQITFTPSIPFLKDISFEKNGEHKTNPFSRVKYLLAKGAGGNAKGFCRSDQRESCTGDPMGCPNCIVLHCEKPCSMEQERCIEVCSQGALSIRDRQLHLDTSLCNLCLECLYACPRKYIDRHPLTRTEDGYFCTHCNKVFPVVDGIHILLSDKAYNKFYGNQGLSTRFGENVE